MIRQDHNSFVATCDCCGAVLRSEDYQFPVTSWKQFTEEIKIDCWRIVCLEKWPDVKRWCHLCPSSRCWIDERHI